MANDENSKVAGDFDIATYVDPLIEYLKQNVDREALRANLKLTPPQRLKNMNITSN